MTEQTASQLAITDYGKALKTISSSNYMFFFPNGMRYINPRFTYLITTYNP